MKSMTCAELGGAGDTVFRANTFEGIADHLQRLRTVHDDRFAPNSR